MKQKYLNAFVNFFFLIGFISSSLDARGALGTEGGGGGAGMLCVQNNVRTLSLLDFWEGRQLRGLRPFVNQGQKANWARAARNFDELNPQGQWGAIVMKYVSSLNREDKGDVNEGDYAYKFLPEGVSVSPPQDAKNILIGRGCQIEGIAYMSDDDRRVLFDRVNFQELQELDRSGLFFHEGLYHLLRVAFDVRTSNSTRDLVACAFAENPCLELSPFHEIPKEGPLLECSTEDWNDDRRQWPVTSGSRPVFIVFPESSTSKLKEIERNQFEGWVNWRFQLIKFGDRPPLSLSFFSKSVRNLQVDDQGNLTSRIFMNQSGPVVTRSSKDALKNMGIPLSFEYAEVSSPSFEGKGGRIQINGHQLKCQRKL